MRLNLLLISLLIAVSMPSQARPAPWYWWAGSTKNAKVCAQTSPGSGWLREARAFKDSHCSIRL
ncbi:MAG: hypothetical protein Q8S26_06075 [Azonexus sp.]|nr:hypothetical protein [Azonexus sp.]